jgi:hypothetical protein
VLLGVCCDLMRSGIWVSSIDDFRDSCTLNRMRTVSFTYWQDGDFWLGHLDEYPDYQTQGKTLDELKEYLLDLHSDLSGGVIPCARRRSELEVA